MSGALGRRTNRYQRYNPGTRDSPSVQFLSNQGERMVEAGESKYLAVLKTRNLLIFRDGQNAENGKIAPNWNVSGTRDFSFPKQNANYRVEL
jgi:hypothetical protein